MLTRKLVLASCLALFLGGVYMGCTKDDTPLSPYTPGSVSLTALQVESGVYAPRISWGGGYASALGVNRGTRARMDSSLAWLIHQAGNGIRYQQRFGNLPPGAEDLTQSHGGQPLATLAEDQVYTFWVAREEVWGTIAANPEKFLAVDSAATVPTRLSGDTLFLSARSFTKRTSPIDLYIGIRNVRPVGRLGVISVVQTDTSNAPVISFQITQTGTPPPDSLLADIGIAAGAQYDVGSVIWEALAVDTSSGQPVYWTRDVISSPVVAGQKIPGTVAFTEFPPGGLQRNATYYVWLANKDWDQRNRTRSAFNYASATFETY